MRKVGGTYLTRVDKKYPTWAIQFFIILHWTIKHFDTQPDWEPTISIYLSQGQKKNLGLDFTTNSCRIRSCSLRLSNLILFPHYSPSSPALPPHLTPMKPFWDLQTTLNSPISGSGICTAGVSVEQPGPVSSRTAASRQNVSEPTRDKNVCFHSAADGKLQKVLLIHDIWDTAYGTRKSCERALISLNSCALWYSLVTHQHRTDLWSIFPVASEPDWNL